MAEVGNPSKLPVYDPKASTFQQYIEDIYEIRAWGLAWDNEKKLRGLALVLPPDWCTRVFREIKPELKRDYETLKTKLIAELDRTTEKKQCAASEFHKLTQRTGESVDDFSHRLLVKVDEAYPTFAKANKDELCVQRFVDGLRSSKLKEQLNIVLCQRTKPPTFDPLVDITRRLVSSGIAEQQTDSVLRVRCFYCKIPGHREQDCRKKKRDVARSGADKPSGKQPLAGKKSPDWIKRAKCYSCQQRGHLAKDCPQKGSNSSSGNIGAVLNHEDNSCPCAIVTLGAITQSAVLDSGASVSCISWTTLTKAFPRGVVLNECHSRLTGPTSQTLSTLGTASVSLRLDDRIFDCTFHVLDSPDDTIILGWDFMCKFDCVTLHTENQKVEFGNLVQHSGEPRTVRAVKTTVIPPRSQRVLRVGLSSHVDNMDCDIVIERNENFELKSGLYVGRAVNSACEPQLVLMNPTDTSKTVYSSQAVGHAYDVTEWEGDDVTQVGRVTDVDSSSSQPEWNIGPIDESHKSELVCLLNRYEQSVFSGLGKVRDFQFELNLKSGADLSTVKQRRRTYGPHIQAVINNQVESMLKSGVIEPSQSNVLSPVVLVKKADNSLRFCLDFRALNRQLEDATFPLMTPTEAILKLRDSKYFTVLDMNSAYNQIELAPDSRPLTAFETDSGVWQFVRLCFGLKTAPLGFQRLMHVLLSGLATSGVMIYLDDVCIHSKTAGEHLTHIQQVLERFASSGVTLKKAKCHFFMESVDYLGFHISRNGIQPGTKGLLAVANYPIPKSWEEIRSFIGLCTYFQRFIAGFSDLVLPLSRVVETQTYCWTEKQQYAFDELKRRLSSEPVLKHPDFDITAPEFIVQTDASQTGLAGVLLQADSEGNEHPVCYASKKVSKAERNYSAVHREALGVIWAVRKFREYVYGRPFLLRTDHKPLVFIQTSKTAKCARWALELAEYTFRIEHVKGKDNVPSDVLSRASVSDDEIDLPILAVTRSESRSQDIIARSHGLGHFSVERTLELAKLVDPTIPRSAVEVYVSKCKDCVEGPHVVRKSPLGLTKTAVRPWSVVHCDFVGPLPRTSVGYEYIFTLQDDLTRFVLAWPLRSATTVSATAIMDRVFSVFGPPQEVHCDNGSVFTSEAFIKHLQTWSVECHYTCTTSG